MVLQGEKLLIHLPIPAPPGWLDTARARFPGVEIIWEQAKWEKTGLTSMNELPADVLEGVTLMCPGPPFPPAPENMRSVRFVQLISAGYDPWAKHPVFHDQGVGFCSGSGIHA